MALSQLLPTGVRVALNVVKNDVRSVVRLVREERLQKSRVRDGGGAPSNHAGTEPRAPMAQAATSAQPPAPSRQPPATSTQAPAPSHQPPAPSAQPTVVFVGSGVELQLDRDQTILDAGLRNGVDLMFSCTLGGCGACMLKVVEGEVEYDDPHAICLTDEEREEGYCLACVGRPRGKVLVEG